MSDLISREALLKAFKVHGFFVLDEWRVIEHIITNAPTVQRDGWVSVKDRLPDFIIEEPETIFNGYKMPFSRVSGRCLVVVNGNVTESKLRWREDYPDKTSWEMLSDSVTHWQPLPAAPTDTE